jgi:hypothetical protein
VRPLHFVGANIGIIVAVILAKNPLDPSVAAQDGIGAVIGGFCGHIAGVILDHFG